MKMNQDDKLSDEFINAFVDGELTPEEKAQVYIRLAGNDELNRHVCELHKIRDLIQLAYRQPPPPPSDAMASAVVRRFVIGLAAGLVLFIGGVAGWFLHGSSVPQNVGMARAFVPAATPAKVLIHVSDGHPGHVNEVLDDVERLMKFYRQAHEKAQVEVIANGDGLTMLLAGISPFADRIRQMQNQFDGLTFIACQNTIDHYHDDQGVSAKLLPGVVVVDSGVAQIMRRQQQGWAYIQS